MEEDAGDCVGGPRSDSPGRGCSESRSEKRMEGIKIGKVVACEEEDDGWGSCSTKRRKRQTAGGVGVLPPEKKTRGVRRLCVKGRRRDFHLLDGLF